MLPPLTQLRVSSIGAVKRKREPGGASDELGLPDPYDVVSVNGAQWLWRYMRRLEEKYKNDDTDYTSSLVSVDESAKYWDATYREDQYRRLYYQYKDFLNSIDVNVEKDVKTDMEKDGASSEAINEAIEKQKKKDTLQRWVGEGSDFNQYLLYHKMPSYPSTYFMDDLPQNVHRLYKLLLNCPHLNERAVFLRSVLKEWDLPHRTQYPVRGKAYLNVTFMSTSIVEPHEYFDTEYMGLQNFFDADNMCCLYAITAPAGLPVLPIPFAPNGIDSAPYEKEVLLPPGLLLVYQGERTLSVGKGREEEAVIHFYQAVVPPMLDPLVETLLS